MSVCAVGPSQRLVADLHNLHNLHNLQNWNNYAKYDDYANYPVMMSQQAEGGSVTSWMQPAAVTSSRRNCAVRMNSGCKRLEEALVETIPAASGARVSQRIAQLQQSLYNSRHSGSSGSSGRRNRPLSIDPEKDYSVPLAVDCSIEYDLPRVARPPPGAKPLLLIANPEALPVSIPSGSRRVTSNANWQRRTVACVATPHYLHAYPPEFAIPEFAIPEFRNQQYPVSSSSSDSGRGTDCERSPLPVHFRSRLPASGLTTSSWNQMIQPALSQLKHIQQHPHLPGQFQFRHFVFLHPSIADAVDSGIEWINLFSSGSVIQRIPEYFN